MRMDREMADEKSMKDRPVGVFDSGVGGISVLREFVRLMPEEDFIYFGDSVHAPYGTKTAEEITELSETIAADFYRRGVKAIAVACNTATSAAIAVLRSLYTDIPVVGIEPAVKPAALIKENPNVIVLATPMTVKGEKFRHLLERFENLADVKALPCPGLMEYVEKGIFDGPELEEYLDNLLGPFVRAGAVDAVVLGCTHYPFLRRQIQKTLGPGIPVIDGSEGTARELKRQLERRGWLRSGNVRGQVILQNSDPSELPLMRKLLEAENI